MAKRRDRLPVNLKILRKAGLTDQQIADIVQRAIDADPKVQPTEEEVYRIDLSNKILFIDELKGIQNAQAPKLLISEGRLRLGTVINNQPVEIEATGTPVIITTTTLTAPEDQSSRTESFPCR